MVFAAIIVALGLLAGLALGIAHIRRDLHERRIGIARFGAAVLDGHELRVGKQAHRVTADTHAELLGSVQEGRRSTATRTAAGAVVAGPVGALVGHAATKKTTSSDAVLALNGNDWTETLPIAGSAEYVNAVKFAQAVNLAARTS